MKPIPMGGHHHADFKKVVVKKIVKRKVVKKRLASSSTSRSRPCKRKKRPAISDDSDSDEESCLNDFEANQTDQLQEEDQQQAPAPRREAKKWPPIEYGDPREGLDKVALTDQQQSNYLASVVLAIKTGVDNLLWSLVDCPDKSLHINAVLTGECFGDDAGQTLLHLACKHDRLVAAQLLIERAADYEAENADEVTCLECCARFDSLCVMRFLAHCGADLSELNPANQRSLLHYAGEHGSINVAKFLVEHVGLDPQATDEEGFSALAWTINSPETKGLALLRFFLSLPDVNINQKSNDGNTILHWSVGENRLKIIEYLVHKKIDYNETNSEGVAAIDVEAQPETHARLRELIQEAEQKRLSKLRKFFKF